MYQCTPTLIEFHFTGSYNAKYIHLSIILTYVYSHTDPYSASGHSYVYYDRIQAAVQVANREPLDTHTESEV